MDVWDAKSRYVGGGVGILPWNSLWIFWPYLAREGVLSPGWALYWMRIVAVFTNFVAPSSQEPPVFVVPVPVFARDLYFEQ